MEEGPGGERVKVERPLSSVLCPCVACEARMRLWTCTERMQVCGENLGGKGRGGGESEAELQTRAENETMRK